MKLLRIASCLLLLSLLSGCSRRLVFGDLREIDQVELVQTLGVDLDGELVKATAATGSLGEPIVLKNSSVSVSRAMREMQDYTAKKYIFYGHAKHLLVGEEAARRSMSFYMEYMERGVEMRLDTGLYVVQGGSAEQAISATTNGDGNVSDLLDSLAKDVELMSESHVFTCGEVAEQLSENGCALCAAVSLVYEDNIVFGGSPVSIQSAGYAVLKEERLVDFLDMNLARGANLLINQTGSDVIEVPDGEGGFIAARLTGSEVRFIPTYADGVVASVDVEISVTCNLDELQHPLDIFDPAVTAELERGIAELERYRVLRVLERSQALDADFCNIGGRLRFRTPLRFDRMTRSWEEQFAAVPFSVSVEAELMRTYDVGRSPIGSSGEEHR